MGLAFLRRGSKRRSDESWIERSKVKLNRTYADNGSAKLSRLALHWLQENIGAFGGDKSKVTIWGESA